MESTPVSFNKNENKPPLRTVGSISGLKQNDHVITIAQSRNWVETGSSEELWHHLGKRVDKCIKGIYLQSVVEETLF